MSTKTFWVDFQTLWTSKFLSKMPQDCCEQFWAKAKMTMMCYFQQWAIELTMQQLDFFSSHFPRKRTPHALFSNSSSHQKSSRRVSSGAVGIALAAQSPVLSPLAVAAAQRQFWCALCRFCSFSWDTLECRTSEGLLILYFIGKVRNKCFYWGLRRSNHGPRVERFTYDFFSFGLPI